LGLLLFDAQTWFILLAPTTILCGIALSRRTWTWGHTVAFSVGYLILDVAIGYWDVYVLGHMDEKFRHAPVLAFELYLLGAGVFSALSAVVFLLGLVVGGRIRHVRSSARSWPVSFAFGMFAALGYRGLYALFGRTGLYAPIAWAWTLCFPLAYALFLLRSRVSRSETPVVG